jgi:type IV secretory pathway ATPase VirB11/archaellum biosynthesis ATPase
LQEDPACTYQPTGQPLEFGEVFWSAEAQARLERIPIVFIREKVRQGLEAYARRQSLRLITPEVMKKAMAGEGRPGFFEKIKFGESRIEE